MCEEPRDISTEEAGAIFIFIIIGIIALIVWLVW